jgi:hypothetical protein
MRRCQFTAKELTRLAVLQLEHAGRLLAEGATASDPHRGKLLEDADLLSRAAVAVVSLPMDPFIPALESEGARYHGG